MTRVGAVLALLIAGTASPGTATELRPPPGSSSCAGCHGAAAAAGAINGRPEAEITVALAAYRSGERAGTVMGRIAKGFSEEESRAIAAYFARRPAE